MNFKLTLREVQQIINGFAGEWVSHRNDVKIFLSVGLPTR